MTKNSTSINPRPNKQGIDRFTSNGYGLKSGPISAARKKAVAEIQAELDGKKAPAKKAPAKKK